MILSRRPSLLIIAYNFPRTQSAGGHRLQAMAKYLSKKGWKVSVLTVSKDYSVQESTEGSEFVKYIPRTVRVIRTHSLEWDRFWRAVRGQQRNKKVTDGGNPVRTSKDGSVSRKRQKSRFLRAPARWIDRILNFPDRRAGWFFPLLLRAWTLLREERFDVVVTSGPPHSSHLPLLVLQKVFAFAWVADFRDPWTAPRFFSANRLSYGLQKWLEKSVLSGCDCALVNTVGNKAALHSAFPKLPDEKVIVLTNGFDEEVKPDRGSLDESCLECDFVFAGFVYPHMLDVYMNAIEFMRTNGRARIPRLHIFGQPVEDLITRVREARLDDVIIFKGNVSYEESLWLMKTAKALFLPFVSQADRFKSSVPSKLYAYLHSCTPFIALVPEGDAARIIERVGGGVVVKDTEPEAVSEALVSFVDLVEKGAPDLRARGEELREYSWEELSTKLDRILRRHVVEPFDSGVS